MTTYIPSLTLPQVFFTNPPLALLLPNALGIAVGYAVMSTSKTYLDLKKPPLSPPGWVFGPVWTVLYGLMGYAAYRTSLPLANAPTSNSSITLLPSTRALIQHGQTLYTIQLVLNNIWTPLFFGLRLPVPATVDIFALTLTTGYLVYVWGQVDRVSAWVLLPYLAWLSFASYVCVGTAVVNDWDLRPEGKGVVGKRE